VSKLKKNKIDWTTIIFAPIATGIASTLLADYFKEKPLLTTITNALKYMGSLIVSFLTADLKVWWVLITFVVYLIAYLVKRTFNTNNSAKEPKNKPDYLKYRSEKFAYLLWRWDWKWNSSKKMYEIVNFDSHCPKCDIRLLDRSTHFTQVGQCPKCNKIYKSPHVEDPEAAYIVVVDNINKKLYK
jgi:hypothetical protein